MANSKSTLPPLADRVRPRSFDGFVGQDHLVKEGSLLREAAASNEPFSLIFWGPPGTGKTTLAKIIARETDADFYEISAVSSGVRDVRNIIERGRTGLKMNKHTILFIDEIHRFNKSQQDALLHAVEEGILVLLGATTDNPSFEVTPPLLSRCRVLKLESLGNRELDAILTRAQGSDIVLRKKKIVFKEGTRKTLIQSAGGDARKMLNALEGVLFLTSPKDHTHVITQKILTEALQTKRVVYDKAGDYHYDTISAFIKSVRGSDPDAAIYWLASMLEGGEQPEFIARRLIILASEDVGNADPQALPVATAGFSAVHVIGMPEASLILAQVTAYLASAPKSNASYLAVRQATRMIRKDGTSSVPLHLRNAPTKLMETLGHGKDYDYPHDHPGHFVKAPYFPESVKPTAFYRPTSEGYEDFIRKRLKELWGDRYDR